VRCINRAEDKIQLWALVNMVRTVGSHNKAGGFLEELRDCQRLKELYSLWSWLLISELLNCEMRKYNYFSS
jgi:hypothetical protein